MSQRSVFSLVSASVLLVIIVTAGFVYFDSNSNSPGDESTPVAIADGDEADAAEQSIPTPTQVPPSPTPEPPETITVAGHVTDQETGEPLAGVTVEARNGNTTVASVQTDMNGQYELAGVPPDATLAFSSGDYFSHEEPLNSRDALDMALEPSTLTGTVVGQDGQPIFDATVAFEGQVTYTDESGTFGLQEVPEGAEVVVKAPGYAARVVPSSEIESEITLEEKSVRGIYVSAHTAGNQERFTELLDLVDRTELNSMVVDIKGNSGYVHYNTGVQMAHDIGAVAPAYDTEHVLQQMKERDIYAIARIVIFEDPILTEARPDLAIQDNQEGGVWRTFTGIGWTNPYKQEVWDYNIQLMREAVEAGFDEVQLDYMRFPTDGPLNRADYGQESTAETRDAAIASFLERAYEAIGPTPAYLTGDIFGLTLWDPGESEIGQNLVTVTERLDYVHPMIYPSHFWEGSMGFEVPNDHPYEVISLSLNNGMEYLSPHLKPKLRPWLQDFSYGVGIEYGEAEVRAQVDAAEEFGASGWLLWNAANVYHEGALKPAE